MFDYLLVYLYLIFFFHFVSYFVEPFVVMLLTSDGECADLFVITSKNYTSL